MYEILTDRARKVMQLANQEAQKWNHEYLGTEHILLGMLTESAGVAANVLKDLGIADALQKMVRSCMISGVEIVTLGKLPTTPKAKDVVAKAMAWAAKLGHRYVGTEHLLLGLMDTDGDTVLIVAVKQLGSSPEAIRETVLKYLGHVPFTDEPPTGGVLVVAAISAILRGIIDGKWVRMRGGKIECREAAELTEVKPCP